ncbi:MAG: hypothetical protein J6O61_14945 [Butyrivibrio sp.]|uniref:hypothetical protein n=1 Tax=Butyrivibrio sp. TaxID=28121 RepID=UPI001B2DB6F3|nr:hypothetical protein [Butyrivibrio sp.]MBO6242100.1 hypothetical protein [Butyrivibrio sp.]
MDNTNTFEYSYSAERAKELEAIRKKYEEPTEDKFEQLKALDKKAERLGVAAFVNREKIVDIIRQ